MATPTAAAVLVGKPLVTGGILVAPIGTALPTDSTTALNIAFEAAGYVSEDGVTQMIGTDVQDIVAWGGDKVRKIQTSHDLMYQFSLIETNGITLPLYYGADNVVETAGAIAVTINAKEPGHNEFVIAVRDGDTDIRIVIPDGQITERGDVTYVHNDAIMYDVSVTCYPDENGNKAYLYKSAAA